MFWWQRVDTLAYTGSRIATLKRELAHERVGKRMQQYIPQTRIPGLGCFHLSGPAPLYMSFSEGAVVPVANSFIEPLLKSISPKLEEKTSPLTSAAGTPVECLREMGARRFSGTSNISLKSPGASMRVKPISARTSLKRSTSTTCSSYSL